MSDLIERQKVIDAVKDADVCVFYSDNQSIDDVLDYTIRATKGSVIASIEQLPSAQPEIIHCRDCKHSMNHENSEPWICAHPNNNAWRITPNHYCGYADMREDQDGEND